MSKHYDEEERTITGTGTNVVSYPTYDELQAALLDLWDTAVPVSQERAREINEMCAGLAKRKMRTSPTRTVIKATHELKTWKPYFDAVLDGTKTFEIRCDDRKFSVGDTLLLREYFPVGCTYSGREARARITYVLDGPFSIPGKSIMAISLIPEETL